MPIKRADLKSSLPGLAVGLLLIFMGAYLMTGVSDVSHRGIHTQAEVQSLQRQVCREQVNNYGHRDYPCVRPVLRYTDDKGRSQVFSPPRTWREGELGIGQKLAIFYLPNASGTGYQSYIDDASATEMTIILWVTGALFLLSELRSLLKKSMQAAAPSD